MAVPTKTLLKAFLAGRDQPCPRCEYNLRGLQSTRCPECGQKLILRLDMVEARQQLLIAGLMGLSAGAGLNLLLLIFMVIQYFLRKGLGSIAVKFGAVNALGLAVEGTAILFWLLNWQRIRKCSTYTRTMLAIGCWVLMLLDVLFFSLTIR